MRSHGPADSESWSELLRSCGLRVTSARVMVLDALSSMGHGTPEQIYEQTEPDIPGLSVSTIYRTLEALAESNIVSHTHLDQSSATYMLSTHADHAHLVCRDCGDVMELQNEIAGALAEQIFVRHDFRIDGGHLSIFGECKKCASRSPK